MRIPFTKTREQREAERLGYIAEAAIARVAEAISSQTKKELDEEVLGWNKFTGASASDYDLSASALKDIRAKCIKLWQIDPTLGEVAMLLQSGTLGSGVGAPTAVDHRAQKVVDRFWDDEDNQLAAFSREGQILTNLALLLEGERFLTLHISDADDQVKLADISTNEITEIITHPQNRRKPALYKRVFREEVYDFGLGRYKPKAQATTWYYRDWRFPADAAKDERDKEADKLFAGAGDKLQTGVLVYHLKTNTFGLRGIPEAYRMYDFARAHQRSLGDLVTLTKALAMFAWQKKVKTKTAATLKAMAQQYATPPPGPGAVDVSNENADLSPVDVGTGGKTNLEAAVRQTLLASIRSFGFGEHWYGDASTGNLATATAMELPAIWRIEDRQAAIGQLFDDLCQFAIRRVQKSHTPFVSLPGRVDTALDINFPPAQPRSPETIGTLLTAIATSAQAGVIDPKEAAYQSYVALGSNNIKEILEEQFPAETKEKGKKSEPEGGEPGSEIAPEGEAAEVIEARAQEAVSPFRGGGED